MIKVYKKKERKNFGILNKNVHNQIIKTRKEKQKTKVIRKRNN